MRTIGSAMGLALLAMPAGAGAQDLAELAATEAAARIRAGALKSEDLVRALVDAIERKRDLNAFITFDRERVIRLRPRTQHWGVR